MAARTKQNTSNKPIGCRTAWVALGASDKYKEGTDADNARNAQLWSLNEKGYLLLTDEAQAIVAAYSAPAKAKASPKAKQTPVSESGISAEALSAAIAAAVAQALAAQ